MLSLGSAPSLSANDSSYGSQNGTFRLEKSADVSLKKETLTVSLRRITVDYVFKNESSRPLVIPTVFPMPPMIFSDGDTNTIGGFTVAVDGRSLEPKRHLVALFGGVDITSQLRKQGWNEARLVELLKIGGRYGSEGERRRALIPVDWISKGWISGEGEPRFTLQEYFTWELEMQPWQQRSVRHSYAPSRLSTVPITGEDLLQWEGAVETWPDQKNKPAPRTRAVIREADPALAERLGDPKTRERFFEPTYLEYKLTTGGNWKGPIQDFTLIIEKRSAGTVFTDYAHPQLQAMEIRRPDSNTILYHATDFVPQEELRFLFAEPMRLDWGREPVSRGAK